MKRRMGFSFNPYFTGLPILMLYKKLYRGDSKSSFNPYFTGLPILIRSSMLIVTFS